MEEQNRDNRLQFSPLAFNWMATNASDSHGDLDAIQRYIMTPGCNRYGIYPESVPVPQWVNPPQIPQNYVEFFTETLYPEIQKQMSYDITEQVSRSKIVDPPQLGEYLRPHNETNFLTAFTGSKHQPGIQQKNWKEESDRAFQVYSGPGAASSKYSNEARRKRSREKAYAADRNRRMRISHWLDALEQLVPPTKEVGQMALMDGVIDHVKYLQNQLKDLCKNRLGDESISNSFLFFEGHGHYILKDQMLNGPLEEVMGKLIDAYPSAATELLQSRGLIVKPMTDPEELTESAEMLGMQEKCPFMNSK